MKNEPIEEKVNLIIPESAKQKESIRVEECELLGDWVVRKYSDGTICLDNYQDATLSVSKSTDNSFCHKFYYPWLAYSGKSGIIVYDISKSEEKKVQEFKDDTSPGLNFLCLRNS